MQQWKFSVVIVNHFSPQVRTNSNKRDSEISCLDALEKELLPSFASLNEPKELCMTNGCIESQYAWPHGPPDGLKELHNYIWTFLVTFLCNIDFCFIVTIYVVVSSAPCSDPAFATCALQKTQIIRGTRKEFCTLMHCSGAVQLWGFSCHLLSQERNLVVHSIDITLSWNQNTERTSKNTQGKT